MANNLKEKDYTLLISKYMYDRFKELGIPVKMTRDTDVTLSPRERVNKVKSFYGDGKDVVVISNHLNAGGANGKNVGIVSSVLFALKQKNFGSMLKFFFCISLKSLFRS